MIKEPETRYEHDAHEAGFKIANLLCDTINSHQKEHVVHGLANGFMNEHRTLQQSGISALLKALVLYSDLAIAEERIDPRNEAIVNNLRKIRDHLKEASFVPFI